MCFMQAWEIQLKEKDTSRAAFSKVEAMLW